jgi:DNA-binding NarL/FixJ family response regulator
MSERSLKLLLIDDDPIFQIGFRALCEQFSDLHLVAQVTTLREALQFLQQSVQEVPSETQKSPSSGSNGIDLVVLEVGLKSRSSRSKEGLSLLETLKTQYPHVPVFLLSSVTNAAVLSQARQLGIEGYCPKGTETEPLVRALRRVGKGQRYWSKLPKTSVEGRFSSQPAKPSRMTQLRRNLHTSGVRQIDRSLQELNKQLKNPQLSTWDRTFLQGRRRELRMARWLVNQMLESADIPLTQQPVEGSLNPEGSRESPKSDENEALDTEPVQVDSQTGQLQLREPTSIISLKSLQAELFDATVTKLESRLRNLTDIALEIDILRVDRKRELFLIILRHFEEVIDELRFSQISVSQLIEKRSRLLQDLWRTATTEFFGKYYTLILGDQELEVVQVLLQDAEIVEQAILEKIPLVVELLAHLLFDTPLLVDNVSYPTGSLEAKLRAEALLQNVIIRVANGVVQPLLNHFADVEIIKQGFYDPRWLSTRSIEKFRNNLSWKYRLEHWVGEPTAIFESRYWLLLLDYRGIIKFPVYAPRRQELVQLSGMRLGITLVLESRDAVAPRLRSMVSFVGSGVVYVLTQVVGRAIGLIGRGIIDGVGNSWQDSKFGKQRPRQK